jgi:hypothetical protein
LAGLCSDEKSPAALSALLKDIVFGIMPIHLCKDDPRLRRAGGGRFSDVARMPACFLVGKTKQEEVRQTVISAVQDAKK